MSAGSEFSGRSSSKNQFSIIFGKQSDVNRILYNENIYGWFCTRPLRVPRDGFPGTCLGAKATAWRINWVSVFCHDTYLKEV